MNAHERAVAEAEAWVEENADELKTFVESPRLPSGETATTERSSWMSFNTRGKPVPIGDSFESFERVAGIVYPWRSKSLYQQALSELFDLVIQNMKTKDQSTLRSYFFEGYSLEELGEIFGVSYQAMQQRLATALQNFKRAMLDVAGVEVPTEKLAGRGRPVRNREAEDHLADEVFDHWRTSVKGRQQLAVDLAELLESGPSYRTPDSETD